ncbi:hypothetical protein [Mesorhizobium sp. J8]|uniref:hypothetical protein n=1 Tax=Mesorhizobium sp. J8 TaxID=2777475 RepID=UPI001916C5F7|nr:hypothetical protein [Mesorhizobium sp. J8]
MSDADELILASLTFKVLNLGVSGQPNIHDRLALQTPRLTGDQALVIVTLLGRDAGGRGDNQGEIRLILIAAPYWRPPTPDR